MTGLKLFHQNIIEFEIPQVEMVVYKGATSSTKCGMHYDFRRTAKHACEF